MEKKPRFNEAGIPESLKKMVRWVNWGERKEKGVDNLASSANEKPKLDKTPLQPGRLLHPDSKGCFFRKGSSSNPKTWASYQRAVATYHEGYVNGMGFQLGGEMGFLGIDIDNYKKSDSIPRVNESTGEIPRDFEFVDPDTGQTVKSIHPEWAVNEIISKFRGAYMEWTPSGGIHVICIAPFPKNGKAPLSLMPGGDKWLEVYFKQYFTMTGNRVEGHETGDPLFAPPQESLEWLYRTFYTGDEPKPQPKPQPKSNKGVDTHEKTSVRYSLPHEEIIKLWNARYPIEEILLNHGYQFKSNTTIEGKSAKIFLAPGSSSQIPGVRVFDQVAFSFHASDPLNIEGGSKPSDSFNAMRILSCHGDYKLAIQKAVEDLGLAQKKASRAKPQEKSAQPAEDVVHSMVQEEEINGHNIEEYTEFEPLGDAELAEEKPEISDQDEISQLIESLTPGDSVTRILEMIAKSKLPATDEERILSRIAGKAKIPKKALKADLISYRGIGKKQGVQILRAVADDYIYPLGYGFCDGWLCQGYYLNDGSFVPTAKIYQGDIRVIKVEKNIITGEYFIEIQFLTRKQHQQKIIAPLKKLATAKGVIECLTSKGAAISEMNAKIISDYLICAFHANRERETFTHVAFSEKLGVIHTGLITPTGSYSTPVEYRGNFKCSPGRNLNAVKQAFSEMMEWSVWSLWLQVGAALFSPFIGRMKYDIQRNPIFSLVGESGFGKSTAIHFAQSMWGNSMTTPLKIERPTYVGYTQTVMQLGGLPIHLDEIHTGRVNDIANIFYSFANRQTKTYGTVNYNTPAGGEEILGVMLTSGEYVPNFTDPGTFNRLFIVRVEDHPPLGAPAHSKEGEKRALILENAGYSGLGLVGPIVYQWISTHWEEFYHVTLELADDPSYIDLGPNWRVVISAIIQTLGSLFDALEVTMTPAAVATLNSILTHSKAIIAAQKTGLGDPASEAFERVRAMLASSTVKVNEKNRLNFFVLGTETIAWEAMGKDGNYQIVIPTDTQAFRKAVGEGGVPRYGNIWLKRKVIEKTSEGSTISRKMPGSAKSCRCIITLRDSDDATD